MEIINIIANRFTDSVYTDSSFTTAYSFQGKVKLWMTLIALSACPILSWDYYLGIFYNTVNQDHNGLIYSTAFK